MKRPDRYAVELTLSALVAAACLVGAVWVTNKDVEPLMAQAMRTVGP